MLQRLRHAEIARRVRSAGATSVHDLAEQLGVSPSTIRRDLELLNRTGALTRVRGGALVTVDDGEDLPFTTVAGINMPDKDAVAARAAGLVRDGDVVLLDIGTTTMCLAQYLRGRHITVVTASLAVLDVLRDDRAVELLLLGGLVRRTYHSLVGVLTEDALRQVRADRAFLGMSGIRPDGQVLDTTLVEVPVKRAMIEAAGQVVLLADRHKFPGTGALRVCGPGEIDVLVTNEGADQATLRACAAAGVEVMLACG
jgi:DeoR/GlpR family transcriptional regulator of sugar metabolism